MNRSTIDRILRGMEESLGYTRANTEFHEKIDSPDTIDEEESPEDEVIKRNAGKKLITHQIDDANSSKIKKDKSHYLNKLEIGKTNKGSKYATTKQEKRSNS